MSTLFVVIGAMEPRGAGGGPRRTSSGGARRRVQAGRARRSEHDSPLYSGPMSGHSKWSQIKRQKGVNDVKRGAIFTKMGREIALAARAGGGDPDGNFRLRLAIEKARAANMPLDTIKRAIEKATGGGEGDQYEEIVYEGYGPGGVAVLVEVATDNRNRTVAEVRSIFTKAGGQLAGAGRGRLAVRAARRDLRAARGFRPGRGRAPRHRRRGERRRDVHRPPRDLHRAGRPRGGPGGAGARRRRDRVGRGGDDREADHGRGRRRGPARTCASSSTSRTSTTSSG